MTDKDKIKFAIRYLKKGLKSKRTPPLYAELMNELGFVKKDKVNNLSSVAEVRLANWQKYEKENAELKAYNEKLLDGDIEKHNKIVELQNRNGELAGQKASLERWLGEAKEIIKRLIKATYGEGWNYSLQVKVEAEKFLKECE